jgi:hypothetical protein
LINASIRSEIDHFDALIKESRSGEASDSRRPAGNGS